MIDYARAAAIATDPLHSMRSVCDMLRQARVCSEWGRADEALHMLSCAQTDLAMTLDDRSGSLGADRQTMDDLHGQVSALVRMGHTGPAQITGAIEKADRLVVALKAQRA